MKNNIVFFACVLLFAMLIWFATSVAINYNNNYDNSKNAITGYEDDEGILFVFDYFPLQPEVYFCALFNMQF